MSGQLKNLNIKKKRKKKIPHIAYVYTSKTRGIQSKYKPGVKEGHDELFANMNEISYTFASETKSDLKI